jgi:ubiquinone/menaquinone biosynthesis C-methylase UbiE
MKKTKQPKPIEGLFEYFEKIYNEKPNVYDRLGASEDKDNKILKLISRDTNFNGKTVLDIGAGTGRFSIPLASKVRLLYALDNSNRMLRILREKIRKRRIKNIRVLKSGFEKIPLPNESVDIIVSFWSFPFHSKRWDRDFGEVRRVLRKGGRIIIVDNHYDGEYKRIKKKIEDPKLNRTFNKLSHDIHKWFFSRGFRHKTVDILIDFVSKRNVEEVCSKFFGPDIAIYLLARDRTGFSMRVSVFFGKK